MCCRAAAPHSATRRAAAGLLKCVVTSEMGWLFPARSSALQGFQGYRGFFVGFCEVMTTADAAYAGGGASCRRRRFLRFLRQRRSRGPGPGLRRWRRTRAMPVYDDGGGGRARWTATAAHDFGDGGRARRRRWWRWRAGLTRGRPGTLTRGYHEGLPVTYGGLTGYSYNAVVGRSSPKTVQRCGRPTRARRHSKATRA